MFTAVIERLLFLSTHKGADICRLIVGCLILCLSNAVNYDRHRSGEYA